MQFARAEGILPAPESSHAIRVAIDEALAAKEAGEDKIVLFNLSGHGHFDLAAYEAYNSGEPERLRLRVRHARCATRPSRRARRRSRRSDGSLRTRVKVCGLCSAADARAAVRAGADALGVILVAESRRRVTLDEATEVLDGVPPLVARIGRVRRRAAGRRRRGRGAARASRAVQLHGDESPAYCASMPVPVIKTFRVGEDFDPDGDRGVPRLPSRPSCSTRSWRASTAAPAGRSRGSAVADLPAMRPADRGGRASADQRRGRDPCPATRSRSTSPRAWRSASRHKDSTRLAAFVAAVRAADDIEE